MKVNWGLLIKLAYAFVLSSGLIASAQVELEPTQTLPVSNQGGHLAILSPIKCDDAGSLYMQLPDPKHFLGGPLLKIPSDGKNIVRYSLDSVPEMNEVVVKDFAIGQTGEVYFLVSFGGSAYVLRFDKDGTYDSKAKFSKDFDATRIGIFGTGDFLITGMDTLNSSSRNRRVPVSAVFNSQGQFVKYVALRRDVSPAGKGKGSGGLQDKGFEEAVSGSFIESADDGNIYVARRSPKGPIFVISPAGVVVKTLALKPPTDAAISDVRIAHGRIATMFLRKEGNTGTIKKVIFSVLDVSTGREVAKYQHSSARLGAALACYVPDTFTFLASGGETLQIIRAEAR